MRKLRKIVVQPSVEGVAWDLKRINANLEDGAEVRLQIYGSGVDQWQINVGYPSFDVSHQGYWGAGFLPGPTEQVSDAEFKTIAEDLIEQAMDDATQDGCEIESEWKYMEGGNS